MSCSHEKFSIKRVKKNFLKKFFFLKLKVCDKCKSELWGKKEQEKYSQWMEELHLEHRHLFQIQYKLSNTLNSSLKELNKRYPSVNESEIVRSLISIYINKVETDEVMQKEVEEYFNNKKNECILLNEGPKTSKKIQFNVLGMEDVVSMSEILGIKPHLLTEDILSRMIFILNGNLKSQRPWIKSFFEDLTMILKAS